MAVILTIAPVDSMMRWLAAAAMWWLVLRALVALDDI